MSASFLDDRRISGFVYDSTVGDRLFTVRRDGTDFQWVEVPSPIPGASVILDFRLTGRPTDLFSAALGVETDHPHRGPVQEVFIRNGENFLQLTALGESDTTYQLLLRDREHVVFGSSGNPVGQNPSGTCQIFSVDRFAGHLRQLTRFDPGVSSPFGCGGGSFLDGCTLFDGAFGQDPATGAIVFDATCDPFGLNPRSQQLYVIRPDGSGFRQLTHYRGVTVDGDIVDVELPGPVATPGAVF